jgi:hypothetical protein
VSDNVPSQQPSDPIAPDAVINVSFPVNEDLIRRVVKAGMRVRWGKYGPYLWSGMGGFVTLLAVSALFIGEPSAGLILTGLFGIYVAAIPYLSFQRAYRASQRHFERCGVTEMRCTFEPEFYEVRHTAGAARYKYTTVTKVVMVLDLMLLFLLKNPVFLPKSALSSEQTTLILSRFKNAGVKVEVR